MPGDTLHINNRAVKEHSYDAIVVGSGISGGWAAKELCEKGLKVLLLERGRNIEHIRDYTGAVKDPWELPHHDNITSEDRRKQPVQSKIYAYNEGSKAFFVNDLDHPYVQQQPFHWIRGYQLGGRSLVWGRQCYRFSDLDFEANAREGIGIDWPIRYKDLKPWYDYVEPFVGISGSMENLPQLPDGIFQPPMELNFVEKEIATRIKKIYRDERRLIIGRFANHTVPTGGRGPCQYRNRCDRGCPFSGYFSSNAATLPSAMLTGNLTIRPFSIVTEVLYNKDQRRATGVRIIDAETMATTEYYARIIFLNASTFNTTSILMNSVSEVFPQGLGNSSGQLGHHVMSHHQNVGAKGTVEGFEDKYYAGRRPAIAYIPRFRNLKNRKSSMNYQRGYSLGGGAWREGWGRHSGNTSIGISLKETLTEPGQWQFELSGMGEMLPYYKNRISQHPEKKDKWGLPLLVVNCAMQENEHRMREDIRQTATEMLEKTGIQKVHSWDASAHPGARLFSVHEMGTARMGLDPATSVLNKHNQLHDVKNVFITDGSCMVSTTAQEPSLTYMALTARACDFAVNELKKQQL